jgi:hypothetical protein
LFFPLCVPSAGYDGRGRGGGGGRSVRTFPLAPFSFIRRMENPIGAEHGGAEWQRGDRTHHPLRRRVLDALWLGAPSLGARAAVLRLGKQLVSPSSL